jgi:tryptophanase
LVKPTGGHAVCLDARTVLPDMPIAHYPVRALCSALYLEGGIRGVKITKQPQFLRHFTSEYPSGLTASDSWLQSASFLKK